MGYLRWEQNLTAAKKCLSPNNWLGIEPGPPGSKPDALPRRHESWCIQQGLTIAYKLNSFSNESCLSQTVYLYILIDGKQGEQVVWYVTLAPLMGC